MYLLIALFIIPLLGLTAFLAFKKYIFVQFGLKTNIILILLLVMGISLLVMSLLTIKQNDQMSTWPSTIGTIVNTKITGERARMPQIEYHYSLNNKSYSGFSDLKTPAFGNRKFRDQTARNVLKNYKIGDTLSVSFNPLIPQESTLTIGVEWRTYIAFTLAILFCSTFLFLTLTGLKNINKKTMNELT